MTEPITPGPFAVHRHDSLRPGPRLIVLGAVHGNETCGSRGIERALAELAAGRIVLTRGAASFVPVTNPLAYARGERAGERNLNRNMRPSAIPQDYEDRIANALCPLLEAHDALLDLHSFHTPGEPFALVGPENNSGALEPFARADEESLLAAHLGVNRVVEGWMDVYARGVSRRLERGTLAGTRGLNTDPNYGVGTTEYMRARGGYGVTLECGQHADPGAPEVAYRAIVQTLACLRMIEAAPAPPREPREFMRLTEVFDRLDAADRFAREWRSFDPVKHGEPVGYRSDGTPVPAPGDGWIVFPNPKAEPGQEWFYFAQPGRRRLLG